MVTLAAASDRYNRVRGSGNRAPRTSSSSRSPTADNDNQRSLNRSQIVICFGKTAAKESGTVSIRGLWYRWGYDDGTQIGCSDEELHPADCSCGSRSLAADNDNRWLDTGRTQSGWLRKPHRRSPITRAAELSNR